MTRLSVCMATYNGGKYINKQLDSILYQLGNDDELIVSDDSSTDNTLEIIRSYEDTRIRIYPNQKFRNPIFNFENTLRHASGRFILLADQDDVWLDNKVSKMLQALADYDLVLSDCKIIDANDNVIEESFFAINGSRRGLLKNLMKNSYLGCCLGMRREVVSKCVPFPKTAPMHDWWIGIVAEVFFRITFIHQPLIYYRRHGVNATSTGGESHYNYLARLKFRLGLIKGLFNVWRRR